MRIADHLDKQGIRCKSGRYLAGSCRGGKTTGTKSRSGKLSQDLPELRLKLRSSHLEHGKIFAFRRDRLRFQPAPCFSGSCSAHQQRAQQRVRGGLDLLTFGEQRIENSAFKAEHSGGKIARGNLRERRKERRTG